MIEPFQALACPLDGNELLCAGSVWRCAAGHSFDIAREGYINLLPVQKKRSRDPGDSKGMVAARRRFLEAGSYEPIAHAINKTVLTHAAVTAGSSCLDAGCGEGYYLRQLAAAVEKRPMALLGLDISKWAIQAAARKQSRPCWIVGSNANLPVQSQSVDSIICVFGFPVYQEFSRVLRRGGLLLLVDPDADHLLELRRIIYPVVKPAPDQARLTPPGFKLVADESLRYILQLSSAEQITDLLAMTPHLFRASAAGKKQLATLESLSVTVDLRLKSFSPLDVSDNASTV